MSYKPLMSGGGRAEKYDTCNETCDDSAKTMLPGTVYRIKTSVRTAIPPTGGIRDHNQAADWTPETVHGDATIYQCKTTDDVAMFDAMDIPDFYRLWGLGGGESPGAVESQMRDEGMFMTKYESFNRKMGMPELLAIVIPCYNEEEHEIEATAAGLTEMVNTVNQIAAANGKPNIRVVLIIIQDGIDRSSQSFRDILGRCKFEEAGRQHPISLPRHNVDADAPNCERVEEVGIVTHRSGDRDVQAGVISRMYVVKGTNRRKHDSHGWFFRVCRCLKPDMIMMTDTGTLFDNMCLARLIDELHVNPSLMGVTARQRVMDYDRLSRIRPRRSRLGSCLTWWLSPAPLQGFEFEATFILNTALFNMVQALPVLPGPCQVLRWEPFDQLVAQWYMDRMKADVVNDSNIVVQTRLAEDRVMSTGCVTNGTYGTKWVPGATFYYEPEKLFQSLLPQRRRWINGTNAAFEFLAKLGVRTLNYTVDRTMRNLWNLMRWQTFVLKFSSAAFTCAFFESFAQLFTQEYSFFWKGCDFTTTTVTVLEAMLGVTPCGAGWNGSHVSYSAEAMFADCTDKDPRRHWCNACPEFDMSNSNCSGVVPVPENVCSQSCQSSLMCCEPWQGASATMAGGFFLLHCVWTLWAHFHTPKNGAKLGTMCLCTGNRPCRYAWVLSEIFCWTVWMIHVFYMFCLLFSIFQGMTQQWSVLYTILALVFLLPPAMTIGQSLTSTLLYFVYFVPFMLSLSFYVSGVFSYSFARRHDSSWGNRGGGQDANVAMNRQRQFTAESRRDTCLWLFANGLFVLAYLFAKYRFGSIAYITYFLMGFVFLPFIPQMFGSIVYMLYLFIKGFWTFNKAAGINFDRPAWPRHAACE